MRVGRFRSNFCRRMISDVRKNECVPEDLKNNLHPRDIGVSRWGIGITGRVGRRRRRDAVVTSHRY